MIKLIHNKETYLLPTHSSEIDLWQFQALMRWYDKDDMNDYTGIISALTGLEHEAVLSIDEGDIDMFMACINSMTTDIQGWPKASPVKSFELLGDTIKVPSNWHTQMLGQRIAMQSVDMSNLIENIHLIVAILVAPSVYGKKKWAEHYTDLAEDIKHAPAQDVVPIAYFFLRKSVSMDKSGKIQLFSLLIRNFKKQVARRWKSLVSGMS